MSGVRRYPPLNELATFLDSPNPVYGTGYDGDVVVNTNTTLSSDMYYNNLTINSNIVLTTNGYRVFVKNLLTLNGNSVIGFANASSNIGSIYGGANTAETSLTNSLGGNSSTRTVTAPNTSVGGTQYFLNGLNSTKGYSVTAGNGITWLRGGASTATESGGGVVILSARYIATGDMTAGDASISAPGTANTGGGVILLTTSESTLPANVVSNVSGFASGTYQLIQVN